MPYPEHAKLLAIIGLSRVVYEFIEWLMDHGVSLEWYGAVGQGSLEMSDVTKLIEEFFGISSTKLDEEQMQLTLDTEFKDGRHP